MWSAFLELNNKKDQVKALREMYRVLKEGGSVFLEMAPPLKRDVKKIVYAKDKDEIIIKKDIIIGKIAGIEGLAMYKHNKKTWQELFKIIKIKKYKISVNNFGGRERLLVQFWKK